MPRDTEHDGEQPDAVILQVVEEEGALTHDEIVKRVGEEASDRLIVLVDRNKLAITADWKYKRIPDEERGFSG